MGDLVKVVTETSGYGFKVRGKIVFISKKGCADNVFPKDGKTDSASVKEVAKRLGIPTNTASKIKRRMEMRVSSVLTMMTADTMTKDSP